jgi:hypothetical protein
MIYRFTRPLTPAEWSALPRAFAAGETITRYAFYDFGCADDDLRLGGIESVSCTLDGKTFFTVPLDALERVAGDA